MMRTRAFESEVFIAFTHVRQSLVTGPGGCVLCDDCGDDDGISVTRIDLTEVDRTREGPTSHLQDRRPELYAWDRT
jgi:predicted amidohydrolase